MAFTLYVDGNQCRKHPEGYWEIWNPLRDEWAAIHPLVLGRILDDMETSEPKGQKRGDAMQ